VFDLPRHVTVVEVGPRDGLQSLARWVDTDTKVALIDLLSDAGLPVIEVTGMAHPRVIPNLQDAEFVLERIRRRPGTLYRALVPNARGAERAVRAAVPPDELLGLIVASETYLLKNQRMTTAQAVDEVIRAHDIARAAGCSFVVAIAGAFWDIYEGATPPEKVLDLAGRFHAAGIRKAYLAGSLGVEDPVHVNRLFSEVRRRWPDLELGYHVHNLAGLATANIISALDAGATFVEGSICGLGGGIAMPGSVGPTGNLATEDMVYLLAQMGIDTGLDIDRIVHAAREVARMLGIEPIGHLARCGSRNELLKGATT
jgi:hydroxymethylglutaryl-CoA lyase